MRAQKLLTEKIYIIIKILKIFIETNRYIGVCGTVVKI